MKTKLKLAAALLLLAPPGLPLSTAFAQGTAFTYQGQLQNNGSLASGTYSLTFSLFNNKTGGAAIGVPVTNNSVSVTNGLFTVLIDFGSGAFTGQTNWLEIGVETNGAGSFTALSPRQQMTPAPYSIYSENAGIAGTANGVAAASVTGGGIASESVVKSLNGLQDAVTLSAGTNITLTPSGNNIQIAASGTSGTPSDTPLTVVSRDSTGSFAAGSITLAGRLALPPTISPTIGVLVLGPAFLHGYGYQNTFVGGVAGNFTMTGSDNAVIGYGAMQDNTTGSDNTASGVGALGSNTTGNNNMASGMQALFYNTTGSGNTANGYLALKENTNGSGNTVAGAQALLNSTGDGQLVAVGYQALENWNAVGGGYVSGNGINLNGVSSEHTAIGYQALQFTTSGVDDTATGYKALLLNTSGSWNTADGAGALYHNTNGTENTAAGFQALFYNTSGYQNTAVGSGALFYNVGGCDNTAVGDGAISDSTNGFYDTAVGAAALYYNLSGSQNTAVGFQTMQGNTTGSQNTAIGYQALFDNTTATNNTADGTDALYSNTIGSENTASGWSALYSNTIGYENTASGNQALFSNTSGAGNTAAGFQTLFSNTSGTGNTAAGYLALFSNRSGAYNTADGGIALYSNTSGGYNTADGFDALYYNTNGQGNTAIGQGALSQNLSGSENIALGDSAGYEITGNDNIDIGNEGVSGDNGIIRIGTQGNQIATYLVGDVYVNGGLALTSDRNAKANFKPVDYQSVLAKVVSLPVTEWNYKTQSKDVQHIGPMAQDFQAAFELSADDKHISVVDEGGVALAAIQGLNQKLEEQAKEKDARIQSLEKKLDALQAVVNRLAAIK